MSTFDWALVGASLLVSLYALRLLFGQQAEGSKRKTLGCGFTLLAASIWSFTFGNALGSYLTGLRLALGVVLILSSLQAVFRPDQGRIALAAISLILGLVLAGPVVSSSWRSFRPSPASSLLEELEQALASTERRAEDLVAVQAKLRKDREAIGQELRALGFADFDALAAEPAAFARLQELAEVDQLLARAAADEARARARVPELESALRRVRRHLETQATLGDEVDESELRALLVETAPSSSVPTPATLEEHLERQALEDLFERDVQ